MSPLQSYAHAFETLDKNNIHLLTQWVDEEVLFQDPFNRLRSRQAVFLLMEDMYQRLDSACFTVHQICENAAETGGFIRWTFHASSRLTGELAIEGVSEVTINELGLVATHVDFWDASEFMERFPVLGWMIRKVRARLVVSVSS